jgi:hypothetical protein
MSYKHNWQLKSHAPDLTPAERLVGLVIADRLPKEADSIRIARRALYAESGLKSHDTIAKALATLERAGVITTQKAPTGSRKATLIGWALTCPEGCQIDHANGNRKLKSPKPQETSRPTEWNEPEQTSRPSEWNETRPTQQAALRVNKKERDYLELVRKALRELPSPSDQHQKLLEKLSDPLEVKAISDLISERVQGADYPEKYLAKIVANSPQRLIPKTSKASDLEAAIREQSEAKRARELERSNAFLAEMAEREAQAVPPPPELRRALGLA